MVHIHKLSHMKILPLCVPLDIFDYLHLSLPVQAKVLKTTPSISSFFTKIVLFYNGSEFTLKYRKTNLNANAYKPQMKTVTSRLNCGVDFGTSSYKRVKSTRQRASSWHQQRLSSGSREKTVPSKVSPILNPSCISSSFD